MTALLFNHLQSGPRKEVLRILIQLLNIHRDMFIKHLHMSRRRHILLDFKIDFLGLQISVWHFPLNEHIMSCRYVLDYMRNRGRPPAFKYFSFLFYLIS